MALDTISTLFEQAGQALQSEVCPRCQNKLFSDMCDYEPADIKIVPMWRVPGSKQLYWMETGEVLCEKRLKLKGIFSIGNKWVQLKSQK